MSVKKAEFSFKGGVHPEYNKGLSSGAAIRDIPLPKRLVVALAQHLGAPAKPLVKTGDEVVGGQLIAQATGMISAPIHAPASGKVVALDETLSAAGRVCGAIVLETTEEQQRQNMPMIEDWRSRDGKMLVERVGDAGVVGMGGAGFPTRVKLSPPSGKPIDTVILNGAECEPYLTADHRMMLEYSREICLGADMIRHVLGARKVWVTIEDNKPDAIKAIEAALKELKGDVGVTVLKTVYPQGSEKQQVYSVCGREVPRGGLPMDVGCLVENVSTAYAVYAAVVRGEALTHRVITVTGDAITLPGNLRAPIGTTYAELIEACGGMKGRAAKVIAGGPMMGFAVGTLDIAAGKTSSGVLLLSAKRLTNFTPLACIACGRCVEACPMRLSPAELSQFVECEDIEGAESIGLMDCIECGCCAFVCPARRPLVQHIRRGKAVAMAQRMAKR